VTQPQANDGYYASPAWRTPAELDAQRWQWLMQSFPVLGQALDNIVTRLDRIEQKLDALEEPPRKRRVAKEVES